MTIFGPHINNRYKITAKMQVEILYDVCVSPFLFDVFTDGNTIEGSVKKQSSHYLIHHDVDGMLSRRRNVDTPQRKGTIFCKSSIFFGFRGCPFGYLAEKVSDKEGRVF